MKTGHLSPKHRLTEPFVIPLGVQPSGGGLAYLWLDTDMNNDIDINVEYYQGDLEKGMGSSNLYLVFSEAQKKHLTSKICSLYNKRDKMNKVNYGDLLQSINALMVSATDITINHFDRLVVLSKMKAHRNPILLELGGIGQRTGNPTTRRRSYKRLVEGVIVRNGFDWTYDEMSKTALAFKKGIQVDEISIHDMPTTDDFMKEFSRIKAVLKTKAGNDAICDLLEIYDVQKSLIDELRVEVNSLKTHVSSLEVDVETIKRVKRESKKIGSPASNSKLSDRIKAKLDEPNQKETH